MCIKKVLVILAIVSTMLLLASCGKTTEQQKEQWTSKLNEYEINLRNHNEVVMQVIDYLATIPESEKKDVTIDGSDWLVIETGEKFSTEAPEDASEFKEQYRKLTDEAGRLKAILLWVPSLDSVKAQFEEEKAKKINPPIASDNGVNFSDLTLIPGRDIATVKIENTTRAAKTGYLFLAFLDKDGLQLEKANLPFTLAALATDTFQYTRVPKGTVSVKSTGSLVIDK